MTTRRIAQSQDPYRGPLLTVAEAGEYLSTGERFIRRLITERHIAYVKVGKYVRLERATLDAFGRRPRPQSAVTTADNRRRSRQGRGVAKRTFGSVDLLPSGRHRARYLGPDGRRHAKVFNAKADAWAWLASQQTHLLRKSWRAPNAVHRTVGDYANAYLARTDLRESTRALYGGLWRHHLIEPWADVPVDEVTPAAVRFWHAKAGGTTGTTALAQSYRLLRAILNVTVADEAIASNPCRLRGAGSPKATRPSRALTAAEALQLAEQLGRSWRTERYRALLLVLAFGGLRFGEATALRRSDVLENGRLRVERSVRRVGSRWVLGEPKTDAGHRTVTLPAAVATALEDHLEKHVAASPDALLSPPAQVVTSRAATGTPPSAAPRRPSAFRRCGRTSSATPAPPWPRPPGRPRRSSCAGSATPAPRPRCSTSTLPTTVTPRSPAPSTPC